MDQLQESILQTAARMFHQKGIRNVSIDDICSELRISKKTFYTHFQQRSKVKIKKEKRVKNCSG